MGMAFAKETMIRCGVLSSHRSRTHSHPLDEEDMREIDCVWERIRAYLVWHR